MGSSIKGTHTCDATRAKWPKSRLNQNMSKLCFLVSLLKWPYWTVLGHYVLKCFVCCAGKSWGRSAHAALKRFGCWDPHRSSPKNMTHMTWKQEKRDVKKNVKRCKDWIEQTSGFNFHDKILPIPHHKQLKQQIYLIYRNCGLSRLCYCTMLVALTLLSQSANDLCVCVSEHARSRWSLCHWMWQSLPGSRPWKRRNADTVEGGNIGSIDLDHCRCP